MSLLDRLYLRLGPHYTDFLILGVVVAALGFTALHALEAVGWLGVGWEEYAQLVLIGGACQLAAALVWVPMARHAMAPLRQLATSDADEAIADAAWQAAIEGIPRMVFKAGGISTLAALPPAVVAAGQADISFAWLPLIYGMVAVLILGAAVLVLLALETAIAPAIRAIDAQLPNRPEARHWWASLSFKLLAVPCIVSFYAVILAAGVVRDSFGIAGRLAVGAGLALLIGLTVSLAMTWLLRRSILTPTEDLIAATERVRTGDLDGRVALTTEGEMGLLSRRFNEMVLGLRERESLRGENFGLVEELRASRSRIVAASDEARRAVERDLHDGAQQNLVLLNLKLGLLERKLDDPDALRTGLAESRAELDRALAELRDLAHGIYPQVLTSDGLAAALGSAAANSIATVKSDGIGRYPKEIEAAVYFCCLEALQNASKYAGDGASVRVTLSEADGELRFEVADDGAGFDSASANGSAGLQNMADRIGALGGELSLESKPGAGTRVTGSVPTEAMAA